MTTGSTWLMETRRLCRLSRSPRSIHLIPVKTDLYWGCWPFPQQTITISICHDHRALVEQLADVTGGRRAAGDRPNARERRHSAAFDDTDNQLGVALCPPRGVRRRGHPDSPRRNGNLVRPRVPTVNANYRLNPATRPP